MSLKETKRTIKQGLYLSLSLTLVALGYLSVAGKLQNVAAVDGSGPNLTANYLSSNEAYPAADWSDDTIGDPDNFVDYYIEIANTNVPSNAGNLTVKVTLPETMGGDNVSRVRVTTTTECTVAGCNTSPEETTTVHLSNANSALVYQAGSTKVTADLNQDGTKEYNGTTWADGIIEDGINLGGFDGGPATIQINFRVRVAGYGTPNLTANLLAKNLSVNGSTWSDSTAASVGDLLKFYLELHNTNVPSEATNVRIKASLPSAFATSAVVTLTITADNATSVSDTTTVTFSVPARLIYNPASTRLTWDSNGDGVNEYADSLWANDDLFGAGIVLPVGLFGCNQYILQLTFEATVVAEVTATPTPTPTPSAPADPGCVVTMDKKVRLVDGRELDDVSSDTHIYQVGETITYRLFISNPSTAEVANVTIQDFLAPYLSFVSGDLAYDPGAHRLDSNQGTMKAGESRTLTYTLKVKDNIPAGTTTQENTARIFANGRQCASNTATVVIGKPGAILASATQLPVTGGAAEAIVLIGSGLALLGYSLRGAKWPKIRRYQSYLK